MTLGDVQRHLASHPPVLLSPEQRTHAAVALILRERERGPEVLFVERAQREGDPWSGDVGFPGGKVEASDAGPQAAAERETREELGLHLESTRYLGRLSDLPGARLPILVSCFVYGSEEPVPFHLSEELRDAFWVPLHHLTDSGVQVRALVPFRGEVMDCPAIRLPLPEKPLLWGLTHRLLMEFLEILGYGAGMEKEEIACQCPNQDCDRHADCEDCRRYHKKKGNAPYCERKEGGVPEKQG